MIRFLATMVIFLISLIFSVSALAETLSCESWYQEKGGDIEKTAMHLVSCSNNNQVYTAQVHGYDYRVDWDKKLTCFYVSIEASGNRILSTTARVPTEIHPENFTDLQLPGGPRLSVNCEMKWPMQN